MRALMVQHSDTEPPGTLAQWLPEAGLTLHRHGPGELPDTLDGWDALVVLGGAESACVPGQLPAVEFALVRRAVEEGLPFLGICLGAQLLAQACGGRVERGAAGPERGVCQVELLQSAADDRLLGVVGTGRQPVIQWHGDAIVEPPPGAVILARSEDYPVQALRLGERAWGLQFHPEADVDIVAGWAALDGVDDDVLLAGVQALDPAPVWRPVLAGLARVVAEARG